MPQTYHQIWLHLVWSTKNRNLQLSKPVRMLLFRHMAATAERKGFPIDIINGLADHVHVLICLNPKFSVSQVMKHLKGESSRWLNEQQLTEDYFKWQNGFSAFSVSKTAVPRVRKYIQEQEIRHNKLSFEDEMKLFETAS